MKDPRHQHLDANEMGRQFVDRFPAQFRVEALTDPRHHLAALRNLVDALQGTPRLQTRLALEGHNRRIGREISKYSPVITEKAQSRYPR